MDGLAPQDGAGGFMPHGYCYLWNPGLLALHIVSDALIVLAYFSIPALLLYFVRKRGEDVPFRKVFWMFGAFIVACGATHLLAIVTIWEPWYWIAGAVKGVTALASVGTALMLVPLLPEALSLKSPVQLDRINRELERALEEKERLLALYEREHRVAGALQRAFLPATLPEMPSVSFDAVYEAGVAESDIGGDWYDAFPIADGRIAISIGDVAGRGLHAAVTMGKVRQSFRVCALQDFDPAKTMQIAEKMLELYDPQAMVTAFFAIYDPITRELAYTNAGHPPPMAVTAAGGVTLLGASGAPLGVGSRFAHAVATIALPLGSAVVLYTDGLIESRRRVVDDMARLTEAVKRIPADPSPHPAEAIRAAMLDGPATDDVAVLVLRVLANAAEPIDITLPAVPENLRTARLVLRRFAYAAGCGSERALTLEIAAGEAITNAIEHAYGIYPGPVRLRARVENGRVVVDIEDRGTWRAPREEGRGRGIGMMKQLTSDFRIDVGPRSKTVHFEMPIEEPRWPGVEEGPA